MSSFSKTAQQWASFSKIWYLIDAKMQPPGKIATLCSVRLQGKHKPIYHALSDCGDHVVVVNTRHIAFSGNKWEQKVYSSHSGYPGGFKQVTAAQLHQKDPIAVIPDEILKNLVEELPQPRQVPRRLNEYTQEEIDAFPRLWTPPDDYRMK
ncbi:39S ribosomal protein L13, mitochondrial isoform X3 [Heterodontus francisci]|uniref:39S ribosomal protein L13, mitochondrial isoform X3 n=1 Tax=Heterodontus francisci TaxID=7792 RepID=UPI00355B9B6B